MITTLLVSSLALSGAAVAPQPSFAVRAAAVHLADGTTLEDGVLWVENGTIRAVGRGVEPPAGTPFIEHDGALSAGIVAAHTHMGGGDGLQDSTRAFLPEARVLHAFEPKHSDFERALAAGITTAVLAPRETNVAGGRIAVVKTSGGTVLERDGHLHLSLHTTALWGWREPTSWPGALAHLERRLEEREGPFAEIASGERSVIIEAWDRHEVSRALEFATSHGLRGALRGGHRAGELARRVRSSGLSMIVGPFAPGEDREHLRSVVALAEAGVPLAFGLDAPASDPEALRLSAALCVREGLEPQTAWRALTSTAAQVAGVADRVGSLERGLDADFVLWSGPPLELTSRVEAVYIGGELVFGGAR